MRVIVDFRDDINLPEGIKENEVRIAMEKIGALVGFGDQTGVCRTTQGEEFATFKCEWPVAMSDDPLKYVVGATND